ncbi:MAG TPA: U32 family peptidase [Anaerolineales bacterium]|nr:U32 family peptidase [Anaerolineales bacterium]
MPLELLAPARDLETGLAAINCGADAVYIGAARFGARQEAGNSLADLEQLIRHAHRYWVKVYVTVNTLLYDAEIPEALKLIHQVYDRGADALIIQDVGLLECNLPPIPLFASTQMHNTTPARVAFLEKAGFQRVILARELSLEQIREIRRQTSLELEAFIHGALCVCYSGQCNLSYAIGGRSGNRGECAQPCRRAYSLVDGRGRTLLKNRYLLSIHDLNLTGHLRGLFEAGVSSFKIEGRLKDKNYVANIVGHYRRALDALGEPKSSSGQVCLDFDPDPDKTFNRGYTDHFVLGQRARIGTPDSPKMVGEAIGQIKAVSRTAFHLDSFQHLHNGDGLSFFTPEKELSGTMVNRIDGEWITPARMEGLRPGLALYRNHDKAFMDRLEKNRTVRKIGVEMVLTKTPGGYRLELRDEDGVTTSFQQESPHQPAEKPELAQETIEKQLGKLGETEFACHKIRVMIQPVPFLPASAWNELRRGAVESLRSARALKRPKSAGGILLNAFPFPETELNYLGNVLNEKAAAFYRRHGVTKIEPAAESGLDMHGRKVMTTKYCLKYQLEACPRDGKATLLREPLTLVDEDGRWLQLQFDCGECVMKVIYA